MAPQSLAMDLSYLPNSSLTDHALTSHIASRYHQGLPFVSVSTGTLIALNTFAPFDINQDQTFKDLAARVYNRLCKRGESQVVVFLGESGSGKSEFRNSLATHLLTLSNNPLSTKIKHAESVFAAFTTTKTAHSLLASRSGHVLELQYDSDATLIGASLLDYRLERARITKVPTAERNYHIFYYLLAGTTESEKEHLALSDINSARYRYLGHHTQLKVGIDDKQRFKQFKVALKNLEFSRADIANICQILAAIIHIGQLSFRSTGADGTSSAAIEVTNTDTLSCISSFLGVRSNLLENTLSYKTVSVQNDRVTLILDQKGARENADELARALYTLLFTWILEKINTRLSQGRSGWTDGLSSLIDTTITVVDFPGFTLSSSVPTLDKLLHNSANEMLYNYMLKNYFEKPIEKFGSEEVVVPASEYFDNSDTVKTLFRPSVGLLSVLDDYTRRDKDDASLLESCKRRYEKNPAIEFENRGFIIRHFAGEVDYSTENLIASNAEFISSDIISLFTSSSSSDFLKDVFRASAVVDRESSGAITQAHLSSKPLRQPSLMRSSRDTEEDSPKKKKKIPYASGQLLTAMDNLIDSFGDANPYFVVCLKPNDHRLSSSFDARCVRQQIKAFGIPEIARRVKQNDFSVFLTYNEFINIANADADGMPPTNISERDQVISMVSSQSWLERDARFGLTGIFLSENAWLQLVDPKMTFAANANQLYLDAGDEYGPQYADGENYYYDMDAKSIGGATTGGGDMFRFTDSRSMNKEMLIQTKELGEGEGDEAEVVAETGSRKRWLFIVYMWTWWVPDFFIRVFGKLDKKHIRVAWREKLAINLMIWVTCVSCVLFLIGFPLLICPLQNVMTTQELTNYNSDDSPDKVYTQIRGVVFDITDFSHAHYPPIVPSDDILDYGGKDSTDLFPMQLSAVCSGSNSSISPYLVWGGVNTSDSNGKYHDFRYFTNDSRPDWYLQKMQFLNKNYRKAYIGYTPEAIEKKASKDQAVVASLNGYVYDFSDYVAGKMTVKAPHGKEAPSNINKNFMNQHVVDLFQNFAGQDVTDKFNNLDLDSDEKFELDRCLRNVFMIGKLDTQNSVRCKFARYFLLAITVFVVAIIGFKFIAALQFGKNGIPDDLDRFVICQVPAYTEDEESLRRAIDSLARMNYDDKRKLLLVICDGNIVGAGNDKPTPRIVLDILGSAPDVNPPALSFESLGEGQQQHNKGKIYSGLYEVHGHIVPYVVVVKVGKESERNRPGNRGKRDSQLLLMRFLNRVHYNMPMNPLELELYHHIQNIIGVNPAYYEYLLQTDADTMVSPESASQFVSSMINDTKLQAICGETEISNSRSSFVTMIQVYEYYISHNLIKAFESLFGSVTCLPGCFSMYRIYEAASGKPLFVSNAIVNGYAENRVDTLHVKNLLHLGEDRYLTTLLLRHNSRFKTKYTRHATAYTVAPGSWSVFLSQRRRWINSTVHNLVELAPMSNMCGFCCFGMRFIVIVDLFSTIIQPVTLAYLAYLFYLVGKNPHDVPLTSIIMLAAIYGLQALIFLLRRRWEMIGWMFVYILAIPVFSLALPLYSFWHMDDFSWGNTRVVQGEKGQRLIYTDEGKFDPREIPMERWVDYQSRAWSQNAANDAESVAAFSQAPTEAYPGDRASQYTMGAARQSMADMSIYQDTPANANRAPTMRSSTFGGNDVEMSMLQSGRPQSTIMPNFPTDEQITNEIREILSTADLMTVTKKSIRLQLERKFGVKLTAKRDYINYIVEAILTGDL
uniref:chitin synthase n=1 Tax=Blastobotrys adeninivorans TaxID=409370 RepID=A0A060T355_BLAAD